MSTAGCLVRRPTGASDSSTAWLALPEAFDRAQYWFGHWDHGEWTAVEDECSADYDAEPDADRWAPVDTTMADVDGIEYTQSGRIGHSTGTIDTDDYL